MNVEVMAQLAQLALTPEEAAALGRDLAAILDYVGQLNRIDTAGVEPTAQALVAETPLRDDTARPCFTPAEALANAPAAAHGMFAVPKILERG
jgi:aspartyl-tRNA(Asn)/glutamyl-tRNA(Gln) amidotransferase subunit C